MVVDLIVGWAADLVLISVVCIEWTGSLARCTIKEFIGNRIGIMPAADGDAVADPLAHSILGEVKSPLLPHTMT